MTNEPPPMAIDCWVNPLAFLDVDTPWAPSTKDPITASRILSFMCPPGVPSDPESLATRYRAISTEERRLSLVPNEPEILETIVWPLRHAKAGFITANYAATIALAGTVAESLAVLLFRISEPVMHGTTMDGESERMLLGDEFQRLRQVRRLAVLRVLRITDEGAHERFDRIRATRNAYVHHNNRAGRNPAADAVVVFNDAVWLACFVIGQDFFDGALVLRPEMKRHLRKIGFIS
jgi:hypothetical protein